MRGHDAHREGAQGHVPAGLSAAAYWAGAVSGVLQSILCRCCGSAELPVPGGTAGAAEVPTPYAAGAAIVADQVAPIGGE
jgi:hypothetical protein